jgi:hypothetical protein
MAQCVFIFRAKSWLLLQLLCEHSEYSIRPIMSDWGGIFMINYCTCSVSGNKEEMLLSMCLLLRVPPLWTNYSLWLLLGRTTILPKLLIGTHLILYVILGNIPLAT